MQQRIRYSVDALKVAGECEVEIGGEVYVLRPLSMRQVNALAVAEETDADGRDTMTRMVETLAAQLTHAESGEKIDVEVLWDLDADTVAFLSDSLLTEKTMRRMGFPPERVAEVLAEREQARARAELAPEEPALVAVTPERAVAPV